MNALNKTRATFNRAFRKTYPLLFCQGIRLPGVVCTVALVSLQMKDTPMYQKKLSAVPAYKIVDLGTLGGKRTVAMDINNKGEITGYSNVPTWGSHAFLYKKGKLIDLGNAGGTETIAHRINASGQIAGHILLGNHVSPTHTFVYADGKIKKLPPFLVDSTRKRMASTIKAILLVRAIRKMARFMHSYGWIRRSRTSELYPAIT